MGISRYISKYNLGLVIKNKRFSELCSMKVGGKIKNLYYPNSIENLIKTLKYLKKRRKKYFIW